MKRLWTRAKRALIIVAGLALALVALGAFALWRLSIPPQPGEFYTAPAGEPAAPGTLIRAEAITSGVPEGAVAQRVLYWSTGVDGQPVPVSGVVIAPAEASDTPRPVVAWAHGTMGVLPECGTSHTMLALALITQLDGLIREGFVVAATDYPGMGTPGIHPYLVGTVEGAAVLDSVRAAEQLDVGAGSSFFTWGHSQGGHASMWAGIMAPEYAPELDLQGVVAFAPAIDLQGILRWSMDRPGGARLLAYALYAWGNTLPGVSFTDVVRPEYLSRVEEMARTCLLTPAGFLMQGEVPLAKDYLAVDPLTTDPYPALLQANRPDGGLVAPLLIAHGTADSTIPFAGSEAAAEMRCAAGETVQLARFPGVSHIGIVTSAGSYALGWTVDRQAGRPVVSTCAG